MSSPIIIRGSYGRSPRGSLLWIVVSMAVMSSSRTNSSTNRAMWSSGNHSPGLGGSRNG